MADSKISALTNYTQAISTDDIPIVDVTTSTTKKITWANFFNSPVMVTPTLGAAAATTINKVTITAPASSSTLTIADGKTLTASNSITLAGTDTTTMTFPTTSATIARTDAANTFTGHQTIEGVTSTGATGTGAFVFNGTPTLVTPVLGVASATSINKMAITAPATSSTLAVADGKTLTANNSLTLAGTDSTTMTFPSSSATVGGLGIAQTWTAQNKFNNFIDVNNAIAASSSAATVPVTYRLSTVTNDAAGTLTVTITTTNAVEGQLLIVGILDHSAVAQTITWVNTENSSISAPTTSNGSTTLPLTVGFKFNSATTKWRCIASA